MIADHGLTLLIPSYKRPEPLAALLGRVRESGIGSEIDIIVADDGPDAGVQEVVRGFSDCGVRLIVNPTNIGYSRNLIQLFNACRTSCAILSADDDLPDVDQIRALLSTPSGFSMGVTIYRSKNGAIYRPVQQGRVTGRYFRPASNHAPGIVYHVPDLANAIAYLARRLDGGCDFALTYPQVVLLMYLLCEGRECRWIPLSPINEGSSEPSGVLNSKGIAYYAGSARLQEFFCLWSILEELEALFPDDPTGELGVMRREHNTNAFGLVSQAVLELKGFDADLWRGSAVFNSLRSVRPSALLKFGADRIRRRFGR
ncbi:glycosyltransferase family 2 protein [Ancylobacter sp.]|uniref:glycosyltransferase family 2 protein n=1 Tax=Ancylobacter sp. TaxID=1872567 RepID=UPI003D0C8297